MELKLHIYAIDVGEHCIQQMKKSLSKYDINEGYITVETRNVYSLQVVPYHCHVLYTSAALDNLFSLKLLQLALTSPRALYLFCNQGHCQYMQDIIETQSIQPSKIRHLIVDGHLQSKEKRYTYAIPLFKGYVVIIHKNIHEKLISINYINFILI